jgi:hypothetical protein
MAAQRIVILGTATATLRQKRDDGQVRLIGDEPALPYGRLAALDG